MKPEARSHQNFWAYGSSLRLFRTVGLPLPAFRASSPHSHKLSARHPQIAQGKQRDQLRRVLGQPFVTDLGETKLAFDDSEGVPHLGPHTGLELFGFI